MPPVLTSRPSEAKRSFQRQAAWSLLDQGVSSLGTMILSIAIAHQSDAAGFGAFATAMVVYALVLNGSRALVAMPFMTRAASDGGREDNALVVGGLGATVLVAVPVAGVVAVLGLVLPEPLSSYLLVLAAATPFLLLQDTYRFVLQHRHGTRAVAGCDAVWTCAQLAFSGFVLVALSGADPRWHFSGWGAAAAVAACYAWWRTRTAPHPRHGRTFIRDTRRLGAPLLVETLAINGGNSLSQFAIAAVGGLAAVAPLRGANVALGPVNVVNGGLVFFITPIMLKLEVERRPHLLLRCAAFGAVIAAVSVVAALVLLVAPGAVGTALLGDNWELSRQVLMPSALALAAVGVQTAAMLAFRARQIAVRTMILHLANLPVPAACGLIGLAAGGPVGAAWGLFCSSLLTAAVLWAVLLYPATKAFAERLRGNRLAKG